jgi:ABC-2 type transport system ATP-binding protein
VDGVFQILKQLQGMGKTIVISSHILPELTDLCSMIGIIDHGTMRAAGPVREVIARLASGRRLRIAVIGDRDAAVEVLKPLPSIRNVEMEDGAIEAEFEGDDATASDILLALTGSGIRVSSFSRVEGGLEDAFMRATSEDVG